MRGLGIFIMAALIIPVLFLSGCRTAETVPEEKPSDVTILYRLDKNGDANLSKEEWQAVDKEGDHRITASEKALMDQDANGQVSMDEEVKALDSSGDGRVSRDEYLAVWPDKKKGQKYFNQFDINKDGYLTPADDLKPGFIINVFSW